MEQKELKALQKVLIRCEGLPQFYATSVTPNGTTVRLLVNRVCYDPHENILHMEVKWPCPVEKHNK